MKNLYISILILSFISCEKPCNGSKADLQKQYYDAVFNCGSNNDCKLELKRQYDERLKDVCD